MLDLYANRGAQPQGFGLPSFPLPPFLQQGVPQVSTMTSAPPQLGFAPGPQQGIGDVIGQATRFAGPIAQGVTQGVLQGVGSLAGTAFKFAASSAGQAVLVGAGETALEALGGTVTGAGALGLASDFVDLLIPEAVIGVGLSVFGI